MARPKIVRISREKAAEASLEVIDEEGLDNFRITKVAKRLKVSAPSLYYHFEGREELLAEVSRLLFLKSKIPPIDRKSDWREGILNVALNSWRSALRHPNAAPLLLKFFPRALMIDSYDQWIQVFEINEVPIEWHLKILEGSENLTFGSALFAAAQRPSAGGEHLRHDDLARANDHAHYSAAVLAADPDEEARFIDNMRAYLRGLPF